MDVLTPAITGAMLAVFTVILTWTNKGRFDAIERRIDGLERRIDSLAADIAAMRSDLTQVALAIGARARPNG